MSAALAALVERVARDNPGREIAVRSAYECETLVPRGEPGDFEHRTCGERHSTPGTARAHAKALGAHRTLRHSLIGYDLPAEAPRPAGFMVEEDHFGPSVPPEIPYREAVRRMDEAAPRR